MKKLILIAATIALITACSDDVVVTSQSVEQQNEIEEIKAFIIPDSVDVKKELVIAAYYEIHPKKACVILAYNDTTRTTAKRFTYSSDSSFVVKELVTVNYNEFKIKDEPNESFIVKPTTVVWMRLNGSMATSAEYERIDVAK